MNSSDKDPFAEVRVALAKVDSLNPLWHEAIGGLLDAAAATFSEEHFPREQSRLNLRRVFAGVALPEQEADARLYLRIEPFDIRLVKTDEGLVVDVFSATELMDEALASCHAFDSDALPDDDAA